MHDSDFITLLPPELQRIPIDDFANKGKPSIQRLKTIEHYLDLIEISHWARMEVVEILSDPAVIGLSETEKIKSILRVKSNAAGAAVAAQENKLNDSKSWFRRYILRTPEPVDPIRRMDAHAVVLAAIERREQQAVIPGAGLSIRCQSIF